MANVAGTVEPGKFFRFTPKRDNCNKREQKALTIENEGRPNQMKIKINVLTTLNAGGKTILIRTIVNIHIHC